MKRKLLVKRLACLGTKHEYFCFFSPPDYAVYHLPRSTRRGGGLAVIVRKGLHVSRNESCILSSFEHFDLNIISVDKVYRRDLMLSCSLDLLSVTESWLTSNDIITIADLTNLLKDFAVYHLPRSTRRGGGLAVITRKGLHVSRNEGCIFSLFEHFDSTITSGNKVFRLLKVHLPLPVQEKWLYS